MVGGQQFGGGSTIWWGKQKFESKNLGVTNIWGSTIFGGQKCLGVKKQLGSTFFESLKMTKSQKTSFLTPSKKITPNQPLLAVT